MNIRGSAKAGFLNKSRSSCRYWGVETVAFSRGVAGVLGLSKLKQPAKPLSSRWELVEENLEPEQPGRRLDLSGWRSEVSRYLWRVVATWLFLIILSHQTAVVREGLPVLSPVSVVMKAVGATGQTYQLTVWSHRFVPSLGTNSGELTKLAASVAEKVGLRLQKGSHSAYRQGDCWVYKVSGVCEERWFEVIASWNEPKHPGAKNQLTVLRVRGTMSGELAELQRRYTHLLSAFTGVKAHSVVEVSGSLPPKVSTETLVDALEAAFSRHRFAAVRLKLVSEASGVHGPRVDRKQRLEGTVEVPGRRNLVFVTYPSDGSAIRILTRLAPVDVPEKVASLTYSGNKWTDYH